MGFRTHYGLVRIMLMLKCGCMGLGPIQETRDVDHHQTCVTGRATSILTHHDLINPPIDQRAHSTRSRHAGKWTYSPSGVSSDTSLRHSPGLARIKAACHPTSEIEHPWGGEAQPSSLPRKPMAYTQTARLITSPYHPMLHHVPASP